VFNSVLILDTRPQALTDFAIMFSTMNAMRAAVTPMPKRRKAPDMSARFNRWRRLEVVLTGAVHLLIRLLYCFSQ